MTVADLRAFTRAEPFQPFLVTLKNGRSFEIHFPDMLLAEEYRAHIAVSTRGDAIATTPLDQIDKLEPLVSPPTVIDV